MDELGPAIIFLIAMVLILTPLWGITAFIFEEFWDYTQEYEPYTEITIKGVPTVVRNVTTNELYRQDGLKFTPLNLKPVGDVE